MTLNPICLLSQLRVNLGMMQYFVRDIVVLGYTESMQDFLNLYLPPW